MRTQLSPEDQEAARQIGEQDRLRFARDAHKKGRWDEAHFGVRATAPRKPQPRPSIVGRLAKWAVAVGVLACAGVFAYRWLTPEPAAEVVELRAAMHQAIEPAPKPVARPESPRKVETPRAAPVLVSSPAAPAGPTAEQIAVRQRGLAHLAKQRPAAAAEVDRFLAVIKRAEEKGNDGLTYERRLIRDRNAADATGTITSERVRLDLAWEKYLAGKNENATRLAHAREVLASLDKRIGEAKGD